MNVLILGATGRVGSRIVAQALEAGYCVTVLARTSEKLAGANDHITIIRGDVLNRSDIERSIRGIDVVVSALSTDGGFVLSESFTANY